MRRCGDGQKRLPASAFVFPADRRWPIQTAKQARAAVQYMIMDRGDPADYQAVIRAIKAKYGDEADLMALLADNMETIKGHGE